MLIHELTISQCQDVLGRVTLARLACARHDQPYVVPVNVYFNREEECLYAFSTVGRKITWMRANPKVCLELDEITDQFNWTTIVIFGRYEEVGDSTQGGDRHQAALELFRQRPTWWQPAAAKVVGAEEHPSPVVYRIRIERMTGRRAARG
ncbi:MAG TPA: pyridoxamine 5'-phosphate oxidase family protein [Vicinamibacterales bacterium]|nr:pyridoxamine 5'-phosphate oxidase family protein [Vicinamibacterales bacterium]